MDCVMGCGQIVERRIVRHRLVGFIGVHNRMRLRPGEGFVQIRAGEEQCIAHCFRAEENRRRPLGNHLAQRGGVFVLRGGIDDHEALHASLVQILCALQIKRLRQIGGWSAEDHDGIGIENDTVAENGLRQGSVLHALQRSRIVVLYGSLHHR